MAERSAHTGVAVGGDRHADAGPARQHAALTVPGQKPGREGVGEVGIVDRRLAMGAEVDDLVAEPVQAGDEELLELEPPVVGRHQNPHHSLPAPAPDSALSGWYNAACSSSAKRSDIPAKWSVMRRTKRGSVW